MKHILPRSLHFLPRWPHFLSRWLPVTLWMAAIYLVSAQPDIPRAPDPTFDFILKKLMHATAYGILAVLWHRALTNRNRREAAIPVEPFVAWNRRPIVFALILSIAYAATDEWHQQQVPGRHGLLRDVAIDAAGAVAGLALLRRSTSRPQRRPTDAPII